MAILLGARVQPVAVAATPAAKRQARGSTLRHCQPAGLAALRQRCATSRCSRAALRTLAVASTDKTEPEHPYFSDDWKEYNRRFQRPVRRLLRASPPPRPEFDATGV